MVTIGQIARVTLARPFKRNAQTPDTWLRLAEIGAQIPDTVRVVIVAGEELNRLPNALDRTLGPDGDHSTQRRSTPDVFDELAPHVEGQMFNAIAPRCMRHGDNDVTESPCWRGMHRRQGITACGLSVS